MNKPKHSYSAGGVVVGPQGKVVVVSQGGTSWSLPKGTLEPGEDALSAAQREIYEETGLKSLSLIKELGTYTRYRIALDGGDDKSLKKTITIFLFTTDQEKLEPIDHHNPEARWVELDQVEGLLTHYKDKEFVSTVKGELQSFVGQTV